MAKHKQPDGPTSPEPQATVGGEAVERTRGDEVASVEGDAPKGSTVYPPPASDLSGERTANLAPTKQLPPDAPGGAADEAAQLRAERDALARVVRNLGGNPDEVCRTARGEFAVRTGTAESAEDESKTRFRVHAVGFGPSEHHADDEAAAVEAFKRRHGVWSLPDQPRVEKVEAPRRGGKKAKD
jgi:hypothetical protein